jgi:hypothetical protein
MVIGCILVAVVAGAIYWVQQYLRGTKASSVPMAQFALASGASISPGKPFELILQINPNLKTFYSFDLSFTYDQTKVTPQDAANIASMIIPLSDDVKILTSGTRVDTVTHTVSVMGIRETGKNDPFMGNTPINLVKVLFNMNAASVLPVSFKWNDTSRTSLPDTIEKKNMEYTGIEPTPTPKVIPYTCGSDDFSGATINASKWNFWTSGGGSVGTGGQATFYIPGNTTSKGSSISSKNVVEGDFSAEVTIKGHSTKDNKLTSNLFFQFANSDWSKAVSILKAYNKSPGELVFGWTEGVNVWKDLGKNDGIDHNTAVRAKIERIGGTIKLYYDKLDGAGYKLSKQLDNYYTGQGTIVMGVDMWGPDFPQASGIFDDYSLTCYKPDVSVGPIDVPTATPKPGVTTGPSPTKGPTPTPVIGGAGAEATTTSILSRGDTLYINSLVAYPAPFRYEQPIKLERGDYMLTLDAIVHVKRGSGLVLVLQCNEATCGTYKKNDVIFRTPTFPQKTEFSEYQQNVSIVDGPADKSLILRVFCEDGSECEIDKISLEDAWGSERVKNPQFAEFQKASDPRIQPNSWEIDATANMFGSVDKAMGTYGSLLINNSAE